MESPRTYDRLLGGPLRGFTVIEMLVVLAIIVIITGIALIGQSSFNRSLIVTDSAYTIALSIRQSQSLGLSSRRVTGSTIQNAGYGVYITEGSSYIQFADISPAEPGDDLGDRCDGHSVASGPEARPGNCLYDSPGDTAVKTYSLDRRISITRICGRAAAGAHTRVCSDSSNPITDLNIVFLRPNTETQIIGMRSGGPLELMSAEIYIAPPEGGTERAICVSKVGQVSVSTTTCP